MRYLYTKNKVYTGDILQRPCVAGRVRFEKRLRAVGVWRSLGPFTFHFGRLLPLHFHLHGLHRRVLCRSKDRQRVLDGVVHDVFDLKFVLVVGVSVGQLAELLRQSEAVGDVLG